MTNVKITPTDNGPYLVEGPVTAWRSERLGGRSTDECPSSDATASSLAVETLARWWKGALFLSRLLSISGQLGGRRLDAAPEFQATVARARMR
jgi:hypothetical protein